MAETMGSLEVLKLPKWGGFLELTGCDPLPNF